MITFCLITMLMVELQADNLVKLPPPRQRSEISLEEVLAKRRSVRSFSSTKLNWEEIGQLLWAAQGITEKSQGLRTAPSAGALYPLEMYVVMEADVYHYQPRDHQLQRILESNVRNELAGAVLGQESVKDAPAVFVIAGVFERTAWKYGERSQRYVHLEAGHAAQNLLLQATALGLGAVPVGAFRDEQVEKLLKLPKDQKALYLIPVGWPSQ
jgi:SagB-type dehydrogenase family enzyme